MGNYVRLCKKKVLAVFIGEGFVLFCFVFCSETNLNKIKDNIFRSKVGVYIRPIILIDYYSLNTKKMYCISLLFCSFYDILIIFQWALSGSVDGPK